VPHRPAPGVASPSPHAPATGTDVVHLDGLRMWIEQSDKQGKQTLGGAEYHVRADVAIRRHWHLVLGALTCCWWAEARPATPAWTSPALAGHPVPAEHAREKQGVSARPAAEKKKPRRADARLRAGLLARGSTPRPRVAGARDQVVALLAGVVRQAPTACLATAAGVAVGGAGH
jgi:hypothetical protein